MDTKPELALRMGGLLGLFWYFRGDGNEGLGWLKRAFMKTTLWRDPEIRSIASSTLNATARSEDFAQSFNAPEVGVQMKAFLYAGLLAFLEGDYEVARTLLKKSIEIGRTFEQADLTYALQWLGLTNQWQGDLDQARKLLEESIVRLRPSQDQWGLGQGLFFLGDTVESSDQDASRLLYMESLQIFNSLGDLWATTFPKASLGHLALLEGDFSTAQTLLEEVLLIRRSLRGRYTLTIALNGLAEVLGYKDDYDRAVALAEESLSLSSELCYKAGTAWALRILANISNRRGDHSRALALFKESLSLTHELGQKPDSLWILQRLADLAVRQEQLPRAACLLGSTDALGKDLGLELLNPIDRDDREQSLTILRTATNPIDFSVAWTKGHTMTMEQAIAYALQDDNTDTNPPFVAAPSKTPTTSEISP